MARPDLAHRMTDEALADLEKRIAALYKEARDDLNATIDAYFEELKYRDGQMRAAVKKGEITEEHYKQWRLNQIGRGERFEALRDRMAERYTKANEVAVAYVNDATPGIYSLNRNYMAYLIEDTGANVSFDLFDEQTVKRIIVEQPDLMPSYPPDKALKRGIDLIYGKKQITASITSSILQGLSLKNMADNLQNRISSMDRDSAIRTARTAITSAQNAGRQDGMHAAVQMGVRMKKQWLATLDMRTRHAHAEADGQSAEVDEPFRLDGHEMMYPGDRSAPGYLVYNCRCTMEAVIDGVPLGQRRARDPETGRNEVVENMTYREWEAKKHNARL